jgi:hypothetical protein
MRDREVTQFVLLFVPFGRSFQPFLVTLTIFLAHGAGKFTAT